MSNSSGFAGSSDVQTSTANVQILPEKTVFRRLNFNNTQACHVKINGSDPIVVPANLGLKFDYNDPPIKTFEIVESGISFTWNGTYRYSYS